MRAIIRSLILGLVACIALAVVAYLGYKTYIYEGKRPASVSSFGVNVSSTLLGIKNQQSDLNQQPDSTSAESKSSFVKSLHENHIRFAEGKEDFSYPVVERKLAVEFLDNVPRRKLLVRNLDTYKLFCLHEILKVKHIDFATDEKDKKITLIIYLPNTAKQFLDDLKYYQIPYELD
ncbi:hypothetical protein [Helicobacter suis]|uniref:hypothetical protein n=1 Tax=Helicobacter suis TaxID=104628 RepID=UPI0013CF7B7D|nr:hypothetical protein [Helicobacter suis]